MRKWITTVFAVAVLAMAVNAMAQTNNANTTLKGTGKGNFDKAGWSPVFKAGLPENFAEKDSGFSGKVTYWHLVDSSTNANTMPEALSMTLTFATGGTFEWSRANKTVDNFSRNNGGKNPGWVIAAPAAWGAPTGSVDAVGKNGQFNISNNVTVTFRLACDECGDCLDGCLCGDCIDDVCCCEECNTCDECDGKLCDCDCCAGDDEEDEGEIEFFGLPLTVGDLYLSFHWDIVNGTTGTGTATGGSNTSATFETQGSHHGLLLTSEWFNSKLPFEFEIWVGDKDLLAGTGTIALVKIDGALYLEVDWEFTNGFGYNEGVQENFKAGIYQSKGNIPPPGQLSFKKHSPTSPIYILVPEWALLD